MSTSPKLEATLAPQPARTAAPPPPQIRTLNDRLSLPLVFRLPLACTVGSISGLLLGLAKGSQDSGLRFQAENAHRLPTTQAGWFLYHKSKNYNMLLGGITEGMKQSVKHSVWVGMYFLLEEGVDRGRATATRVWKEVFRDGEYRRGAQHAATAMDTELIRSLERQVEGNRDCASSMLAGLGTAGIFSAWNRFPLPTAARTAKMGAKAGLAFGVLQDILSIARGRGLGYFEFVKRHLGYGEIDLEESVEGGTTIK